jgi:hypothetical protein
MKKLQYFLSKMLYFHNFTPFKNSFKFSNSSSKYASIALNYTNLEKDLQPTLKSLGQFLFTKINLSKLFNCKWNFLNLISNSIKEKIPFMSICDSTITKIQHAKNPIVSNIVSCLSCHWKKTFYIFDIHLITLVNQEFSSN